MKNSAIFRYKEKSTDKIIGLKEAQAELLIILERFHNFCTDFDIKYSLAYGSLLGAIRNNGMIPWDDDIDIMMTFDNYLKLKSNLDKLSSYKICSMSFENVKHLYTNEIRLFSMNLYRIISDNKHKFLTPLCIDVFPLRAITNEQNKIVDKNIKIIEKCKSYLILKESKYESKTLVRYYIRMLKKFCLIFVSERHLHKKIERCLDNIRTLSVDDFSLFSPYSSSYKKRYKPDWFKNYINISFNNIEAMIANESKEILDMVYPGWQTPVDRYQGKSNFFKFVIRK